MKKFYTILFCLVFSFTFASNANYTFHFNKLVYRLETENSVSRGFLALPSSKHHHADNNNCMILCLPFGLTISQSPAIYSILRSEVYLNDFDRSISVNEFSLKQQNGFPANVQTISYCLKMTENTESKSKKVDFGNTEKIVLKESINWTAPNTGANETFTEKGSLVFLLNSPANNLPIKYVNLVPKARIYVATLSGFAHRLVFDFFKAILRIVFN